MNVGTSFLSLVTTNTYTSTHARVWECVFRTFLIILSHQNNAIFYSHLCIYIHVPSVFLHHLVAFRVELKGKVVRFQTMKAYR